MRIPRPTAFIADAARVLTGNTLLLVFTFVSGVAVARGLGPSGQGTVSALMVFPVLFTTVAEMGIRQATVRAVPRAANDGAIVGVILSVLAISSTMGVVACGALLAIQRPAGVSWGLGALALLLIPARLATSYGGGFLIGKQRLTAFSRLSWSGEAARAALLFLLVCLADLGVLGALSASLGGALIAAASTALLVRTHAPLRPRWDKAEARRLLATGTVYALSLLVLQLNYQGHIIMLTRFSTVQEVGIFSLAANLAMMLWRLPNAVGVVIFARSASAADPKAFSLKVARAVRFSFVIVLGAASTLYVAATPAVDIVFGHAFHGSASVVRLMLPGIVAFTVFRVMNMDLAGRGKPHLALYTAGPALLVAIGVNAALIPTLGARGSAIASSLGLTVAAALMVFVYLRETGLTLLELLMPSADDLRFFRGLGGSR